MPKHEAAVDKDPSGHYDVCGSIISPPGHRPTAFCQVRVWWPARRPLGWKSGKADDGDHSRPHTCREWEPEEDARIRALAEETALNRYGEKWLRVQGQPVPNAPRNHGRVVEDETGAFVGTADLVEVMSPVERRKRARRDERRERAAAREPKPQPTVTLNGLAVDASERRARKTHPCASGASCAGTGATVPGEPYIESRVGVNAFSPDRFCGPCASSLGYAVSAPVHSDDTQDGE